MKELEAIEKLEAIDADNKRSLDKEKAHIDADALMVEFLESKGFEKLANKYREMVDGFWYS